MPTPLTAKGSTKSSPAEQVMVLIFGGIPFFAVIYLIDTHRVIHFDDPIDNILAHAGLFVFPVVGVTMMHAKPVVYESSDNDIILDRPKGFSCWREGWWALFILWATPVFGLMAIGQDFYTRYLPQPAELSTGPGQAIVIMLTVFAVGAMFMSIVFGRSEVAPRVSGEGLRTGILRFFTWNEIDHMSKRDNIYVIYHRVNPALPASSFRVSSPESQGILERFLSEHQIRISNEVHPAFQVVKVVVVLGFAANLAADFWLRYNTSLSLVPLVWISFGIGVVLTLLLERYRGIHKWKKYWPGVVMDENIA